MWFKLAGATFINNLGTMDSISNSWNVSYTTSNGIIKTSGNSSVTKGGTWTGTFTLSADAEFTSATLIPSSAGTVSHSVSGTTVTITITNVSANCTLDVVATVGSSSGGGDVVNPSINIKTYELSWASGGVDVNSGKENTMENRRRTQTYIPIEYGYARLVDEATAGADVHVVFFDANKTYLTPTSASTAMIITVNNTSWANLLAYMPEGAVYFRLVARTGDETQDSLWQSLRNTPIVTADVTALVWEAGGIVVTNGKNNNADDVMLNRRRHLDYISISYKTIKISGGNVEAHIIFYDEFGKYLGTTMSGESYAPVTINNGATYDVTSQAPANTVAYRIMSRTGDAAQDAYWSFSK